MFIDSKLLVLLVVGSISRDLIHKHRRTRAFTPDQFDSLDRAFRKAGSVLVTPNTLTEASNLLEDPKDTRFLERLGELIEQSEEVVVASKVATRHPQYRKVGLTDAVLLEEVSAKMPLVTTDYELHGIASAKGEGVAYNFWHYQDL